jgi:multisubunit Na+/H+ antiporter MnhG subunit
MTILLGLILKSGISTLSAKILILLILIFILTPVVSHAIARSAHLQGKTPMIPFAIHPKEKDKYKFLREK